MPSAASHGRYGIAESHPALLAIPTDFVSPFCNVSYRVISACFDKYHETVSSVSGPLYLANESSVAASAVAADLLHGAFCIDGYVRSVHHVVTKIELLVLVWNLMTLEPSIYVLVFASLLTRVAIDFRINHLLKSMEEAAQPFEPRRRE